MSGPATAAVTDGAAEVSFKAWGGCKSYGRGRHLEERIESAFLAPAISWFDVY